MKSFFCAFLLLSASLAIKIKIKTPRTGGGSGSGSGGGGQSPVLGGWSTSRSCDPVAPQIQMGTLFSVYAEQLYNIFSDSVNELLLVKHERQVVAGVNHRLIFRVRDRQTNDKLYIGMSLFVDLQGGVRVTGYLESFELSSIVAALGFADARLFRYRCDNLNGGASLGFEEWARDLAGGAACQAGTGAGAGGLDDLNAFDHGNQYNPVPAPVPVPVPVPVPAPVPTYPPQPQTPFGGNDSPFDTKTISINIRGRHKDGTPFLIGSSRPKTQKP